MKSKTIISEDMEQYHFEDDHNPKLNVNIIALFSDKQAMLIDTGYACHAEEVRLELEKRGVQVTDILLTHYHPDHAAGAAVFKDVRCYCSEQYLDNYRLCSEVWDQNTSYLKATNTVKPSETLQFGKHQLKFHDSKAHSADSLIIEIDEKFLCIGDLIMRDVEDKVTYPYICKDGSIERYLKSLEFLRERKDHRLLLAHGKAIHRDYEAEAMIAEHERYFNMLMLQGATGSYDEITSHWSFPHWHQNNLKLIEK